MDRRDLLAQHFEENRAHLRALAYRMLGSTTEADDAVQEGWIRLSRSDPSEIANVGGWLTIVVARVCLDMLRSRKSRREESLGTHVPDRILSRNPGIDPEHEAVLADSVGLALLVVLEMLAPPNGSHSCCTTCSACRSRRSRRWSTARPPQPASSPAARAGACKKRLRSPTPTWPASAG